MKRAPTTLGILFVFACPIAARSQSSFQRGDSNADGSFNISDASHLLGYLFLGAAAPPCLDAADANDDGVVDVSDAPFSLGYLFLGGPPPPAPFVSCGVDPTADAIGCASYPPCPQDEVVFPRPEPDPCGQLGNPCESAVIGPYTMVSTPDGDGLFTTATHSDGNVLHLTWLPAIDGGTDLIIARPEGPASDPLRLGGEALSLRTANILGAIALLLNTHETQAGGGAQAEPESPGNEAGCDPDDVMHKFDCTSCGGCCDIHDVCIDMHCKGPDDSGDLRDCLDQELDYKKCVLEASDEAEKAECESLPRCSEECNVCHHEVVDCFKKCLRPFSQGPGPSNCCDRGDCGQPQQCILNGVVETDINRCQGPGGTSWGDPHLISFDRLAYDFQAVGEFVMVHADADDLELQVRTAPYGRSRHVAVAIAFAMNVAGDRVGVYLRAPGLMVNGVPAAGAGPIALPGGGEIQVAGLTTSVRWPDGSLVQITSRGNHFNLNIRISLRAARSVTGLLGDADGRRENDLRVRGGDPLPARPTLEALYQVYGESWRVTAAESLFDYLNGESMESFIDRTFPDGLASVKSLTAEVRSQAEAACAAAGVTDPALLEACVLDVGFTGDAGFAESAGDAPAPDERLEPPACEKLAVTWTDWTSGNASEASGDLGGMKVMLTGKIANPQVQGGVNYWAFTPATFTKPGIVDDPPPTSDIIAYFGGPATGVQTLAFSSPVVDPVMAIFSLGQPAVVAKFDFDTPFEILNVGPGRYGNGTLTADDGDVLTGREGYGLIQFHGLISTITWTLPVAENWFGIQVGVVNCR